MTRRLPAAGGYAMAGVLCATALAALSHAEPALAQCPTTVSRSVILSLKDPDARQAAESAPPLTPALMAQYGGVQAMIQATEQQIAANDQWIAEETANQQSLAAQGLSPDVMSRGGTKAMQMMRDGQVFTKAYLDLLRCHAGRGGGATGAGNAAAQAAAQQNLRNMLSKLGRKVDDRMARQLDEQQTRDEGTRRQFDAAEATASGERDAASQDGLKDILKGDPAARAPSPDLQAAFDDLESEADPRAGQDPAGDAPAANAATAPVDAPGDAPAEAALAPDTCPPGARQLDGTCDANASARSEPAEPSRAPAGELDPLTASGIEGESGPERAVRSLFGGDEAPSEEDQELLTDVTPYLKEGLKATGEFGEEIVETVEQVEKVKGYWDKLTGTVDYVSKKIEGTATAVDDFKAKIAVVQESTEYVFPTTGGNAGANALAGELTRRAVGTIEATGETLVDKVDNVFKAVTEDDTAAALEAANFDKLGETLVGQMCPMCVDAARAAKRIEQRVNRTYEAVASIFR